MKKPCQFAAGLLVACGLLFGLAQCAAADPADGASNDPPIQQTNSADRLLFWTGWQPVADLTDSELDLWKSRGVGGFICSTRHLKGMGGTQNYTGNPDSDLAGSDYETQRRLRDSGIVQRAKNRGMKMVIGCHSVNYFNTATPFRDWFDDAGWSNAVTPKIRDFAAAANLLGFDAIALDQELYVQTGRKNTATWRWDYPGNTHTEAEVRAKARERGRQMMKALLEGYPGLEIFVYHFEFPGTWEPIVQKAVNKIDDSSAPFLFTDFWDGMTSVDGYGFIHFINALFYKGPHIGTLEAAFQYEYNGFFSTLSRRFSNWPYASSRIFLSPFCWINGDGSPPGTYSAPRPPEYVAAQLAAFKKWGMGGQIANFCYGGLDSFDYSPYITAMQKTAKPQVADADPPKLEIISPKGEGPHDSAAGTISVEGFARDNLAIRLVRWQNDRGGKGTAAMNWVIESDDYKKGYKWRMNWSVDEIALQPGLNPVVITTEDIKGLATSKTLTVRHLSPH